MSDLLVVAFDSPTRADEVMGVLKRMQRQHLVDLEDAVTVRRDGSAAPEIIQTQDLVASGAVGGSLWGSLVGLIFLNPILGLVVGAGTGALAGYLTDIGIDDTFLEEVAGTLGPDTSAVFILIRQGRLDRVMEELQPYGGRLLRSSLSSMDEDRLRQKLSAATAQGFQPPAALGLPVRPSAADLTVTDAETGVIRRPGLPPSPGDAGAPGADVAVEPIRHPEGQLGDHDISVVPPGTSRS